MYTLVMQVTACIQRATHQSRERLISMTRARAREADATRERIIDAAMRLFGEHGYTRTTTRAIATAAGVNEVTLFRHFGSKKDLLLACVDSFNAAGFATHFQQELTGDYAADIATMARWQVRDVAAAYQMLRLMLCDASAVPEVLEALQRGARSNHAKIAAYFQRQIDAGTIRPGLGAEALAFALNSLFSTSILVQHTIEPDRAAGVPEALLDQLIDLFVRGTVVPQEDA